MNMHQTILSRVPLKSSKQKQHTKNMTNNIGTTMYTLLKMISWPHFIMAWLHAILWPCNSFFEYKSLAEPHTFYIPKVLN